MQQLEPSILWNHFSQLNAIPRASKNERQVINFIKSFGFKLGLETIEDETGNVLIRKPASSGVKSKPTIILQGHLDMVHQKNEDVVFDFETKGIEMHVEEDWVKAKGTTLGADNGIGVAAMMSVLASKDLVHPPIEALFTIDEEIGMTGAMGLKEDFLKGSILLNLDSEDDSALTVGSAGGVDVFINGTYETIDLPEEEEYSFFQLSVKGLSGGHSGVDIHKGLSNAIKLLTRVLFELNKEVPLHIHSISGGDLTNAIPRESHAIIALKKPDATNLRKQLRYWISQIQKENSFSDPDIKIEFQATDQNAPVLSQAFQAKLLASLYSCPNGIYRMTPSLNNLVQSSNNLAKIKLEDGQLSVACHTRSFLKSERDDLVNVIRTSFMSIDATVEESGPYPGWNPAPNTKTVETMKKVYNDLYGQMPEIFAIHAGLECGILAETYPHLELISFGPNITGAHSPDEALQISSTQKFWDYLKAVLIEL